MALEYLVRLEGICYFLEISNLQRLVPIYGDTVNQQRGGEPFYDRTDLFLLDLSNYYANRPHIIGAFKKYRLFFDLFVDFTGFIEFFELDMFLNQNSQIINLLTDMPFNDGVDLVNKSQLLMFPKSTVAANALLMHSNTRIYIRTQKLVTLYFSEPNFRNVLPDYEKTSLLLQRQQRLRKKYNSSFKVPIKWIWWSIPVGILFIPLFILILTYIMNMINFIFPFLPESVLILLGIFLNMLTPIYLPIAVWSYRRWTVKKQDYMKQQLDNMFE